MKQKEPSSEVPVPSQSVDRTKRIIKVVAGLFILIPFILVWWLGMLGF